MGQCKNNVVCNKRPPIVLQERTNHRFSFRKVLFSVFVCDFFRPRPRENVIFIIALPRTISQYVPRVSHRFPRKRCSYPTTILTTPCSLFTMGIRMSHTPSWIRKWLFWITPLMIYFYITVYLHSKINRTQKAQTRIILREEHKTSSVLSVNSHRDAKINIQPSANYQIDPEDLWESSQRIPLWMKNYFRWHKEIKAQIDQRNQPAFPHNNNNTLAFSWNQHRYLLVTCLKESPKCGGTADRLMSLPFLIRIAASTQRILMIKWGRPAQLEEFLLPPKHGFDWRIPQWLFQILKRRGKRVYIEDHILQFSSDPTVDVLKVRFQSHDHGSVYYNKHRQALESTFEQVYHDFWRVLFTPAPSVREEIVRLMRDAHLFPNRYGAAHLRANYAEEAEQSSSVRWAQNAIKCTTQLLHSSGPVFFASDSDVANEAARRMALESNLDVITRRTKEPPLHLDKTSDWQNREPKAFYDTFIDLLIMGNAKCVTFSVGNFGKLASLISFNHTCSLQHLSGKGAQSCELYRTSTSMDAFTRNQEDTFILSVEDGIESDAKSSDDEVRSGEVSYIPLSTPQSLFPFQPPVGNVSIWSQSKVLPNWAKEYFDWHNWVRQNLTEENYRKFRFLILICPSSERTCGGTADRLQPIPFLLRIAKKTNRIILIRWERPCALENFLLPPLGGLDWRVPDFLLPYLSRSVLVSSNTIHKVIDDAHSNRTVVRTRLQAHDHGSDWYNEQASAVGEPLDAFRQHFRDIWYTFFTPTAKLANRIKSSMDDLGLRMGGYSFAHLRANYGIERRGRSESLAANWTVNALNCLSNIRPGPYYFASDNELAKNVAANYSVELGTPVKVFRSGQPIIHLDQRDVDESTPLEHFYLVWIDLYLMALSDGCMSYNVGGFGKLGKLMSGRTKCSIRHWTKGVSKASARKEGCKRTIQTKSNRRPRVDSNVDFTFLTPIESTK